MFDFAGSLLHGLFSSCSEWRPLSSCGARASRGGVGFSSCGRWAQQLQFLGSRAQAQPLCCQGLTVPWYVGHSQVRDRTCVSCIGRWTLHHWAIREALKILIIMNRVKDKRLKRWYSTPVQNRKAEDWFSILALQLAAAKLLQSCLTLCDPIDGSPRDSPVPGILQARTLEWVAVSFSKAWKWKVKVKSLSRVRLLTTPWTAAHQAPPSVGFSRQEYWSGVQLPSPALRLTSHVIMNSLFNLSILSSSSVIDGGEKSDIHIMWPWGLTVLYI